MSDASTKSRGVMVVLLMASLVAGCSESPEEAVYQTFKCAKVATMLGEDADAQVAMRNTDHLLSKIDTGGSPARYGMAMGARFQEEVPLYNYDREGQFNLLLKVYESGRCKELYRNQMGIPEYVPGEESGSSAASTSSDTQSAQSGAESLTSDETSTSDVIIDPPMLGSEADPEGRTITRPTQVFQPDDTIFLLVPSRGDQATEHRLTVKWTFDSEGQVIPVHNESKVMRLDGALVTMFHLSKPDGWPSGRYMAEIQLDGRSMRAVSFTVVEPAQASALGAGRGDEMNPNNRCTTEPTALGKALCSDANLAALDRKLDDMFSRANAGSKDPWELDQTQGQWRTFRRDSCNGDVACLTEAYEERIRALSSE